MTEDQQIIWEPSAEQIESIILLAMKGIAQQCAGYINDLKCPPEFISVMLRDIAEAFETVDHKGESDCSCC